MALSDEQVERRRGFLGGSDANILVKENNDEEIRNLWLFKRGLRDADDLSDVLQVQLGSFTEPFNRFWFTKQTKLEVINYGDERSSFDFPFMSCTLDGLVFDGDGKFVYEAKHTSAFSTADQIQQWYYAQLQHNIFITDAVGAYLSVIYGNHKWEVYRIERDNDYINGLIEIEAAFWHCVETGEEPVAVVPPKPKLEAVRKVDMSESNSWAEHANTWLSNKGYAKAFEAAVKEIKALVDEDVAEAFGHGIKASRSKNGAITIKELKNGK